MKIKISLYTLLLCALQSFGQTWQNPTSSESHLFFNIDGNDPSIKYTLGDGFLINAKYQDAINFTDGSGTDSNLYIDGHSNRVGIRTTSPTHTLEVVGNALFRDNGGKVLVINPDGNNRRGIISSNYQLVFIADKVNTYNPDKRIIFGSGGETPDDPNFVTYMMMNQGKVAIGTTDFSGDHKLRVEGSIGAREIKVEVGTWSDYVFEEEYNLPTLEEVEKHIREKGHLINIPSAKEVEENGVELGEMNKLLLEKIEELTLYVIELKNGQVLLEQQNRLLLEIIEKTSNK